MSLPTLTPVARKAFRNGAIAGSIGGLFVALLLPGTGIFRVTAAAGGVVAAICVSYLLGVLISWDERRRDLPPVHDTANGGEPTP